VGWGLGDEEDETTDEAVVKGSKRRGEFQERAGAAGVGRAEASAEGGSWTAEWAGPSADVLRARAMSAHSDGRLPPTRADAGLRPTSTDDDESSLIFLYVYTVFPRSQSRSRSRSRKECDFSIRNI
jgi:hypothetical protein